MKKGNQRCTIEEIQQMRELYKLGLTFTEIGKRLNRDHTTPLYWVKKKGDYNPNRKVIQVKKDDNPPTISLIEIEKPKIEKTEVIAEPEIKEPPIDKTKFCEKCGKEKTDPKWLITRFCSRKCWHEYHFPLKNYW